MKIKGYRKGDIARIKEDVQAHDSWPGTRIKIVSTKPGRSPRGNFEFIKIDEGDNRVWSAFNFDEVEIIKPMMECGHYGLYNDSDKMYFCPWCE